MGMKGIPPIAGMPGIIPAPPRPGIINGSMPEAAIDASNIPGIAPGNPANGFIIPGGRAVPARLDLAASGFLAVNKGKTAGF